MNLQNQTKKTEAMSVTVAGSDLEVSDEVAELFDELQPKEVDVAFKLRQLKTLANRRHQAKWRAKNREAKNAWMRNYLRRPDKVEKHRAYMKARYWANKKTMKTTSKTSLVTKPKPNWRRKLTVAQAKQIRLLRSDGMSQGALARMFGLAQSSVRMILTGKTYKTPEVNYG